MPRKDTAEQRIRERAYRIWQESGRPAGKDKEHWERASQEIEEEDAITQGDQDLKSPDMLLDGNHLRQRETPWQA